MRGGRVQGKVGIPEVGWNGVSRERVEVFGGLDEVRWEYAHTGRRRAVEGDVLRRHRPLWSAPNRGEGYVIETGRQRWF